MLTLSAELRAKLGRNVYGHESAIHYYQGHYYGAEGNYLFSNPEQSPPGGYRPPKAEALPGDQQSEPRQPANPPPAADDARAVLSKMTVSQLQKMQRLANVPEDQIIKGQGAKAKLIEFLLSNTQ